MFSTAPMFNLLATSLLAHAPGDGPDHMGLFVLLTCVLVVTGAVMLLPACIGWYPYSTPYPYSTRYGVASCEGSELCGQS